MAWAALGMACSGGGGGGPTPDVSVDDGADGDTAPDIVDVAEIDTWEPPTAWADHVEQLLFVEEATASGDLASGQVVDLDWADEPGVNCWLGPESAFFSGHTVFYALGFLMPIKANLEVVVEPDAGVDVNAYAVLLEPDVYFVPPNVPSVTGCHRSFGAGAGEVENLSIHTISNPYNVLLAIAGPNGVTEGGFTVSLSLTK